MPRDFLPPPASGAGYAVAAQNGGFFDAGSKLLTDVGTNMSIKEAQTEGRVPSPLSRAYMFYTALFGESLEMAGNQPSPEAASSGVENPNGEGRRILKKRARAAFRGICAVFALREALGLDLSLKRIQLTEKQDPIARVLVPNLNGAPGGVDFWRTFQLFTVRPSGNVNAPAEVLGGLSPLTAIFPAANPPARALAGVFWYEPPEAGKPSRKPSGTWHDPTGLRPTGSDTPISPLAQSIVRGALAKWVGHVVSSYSEADMEALGITARGAQLLRKEFEAWQKDLSGAANREEVQGIGVEQAALGTETGARVPDFLLAVCRGVGSEILSDLPVHRGKLVVSSPSVADATVRLWGRRFGDRDLRARAEALPRSGDNLGAALGLGDAAIPVSFVSLDKMFTPRLTILTQQGISDEWRALPVEYVGSTDHALFPFHPEILELLTPDELVESATAGLSQDQMKYIVQLKVGSQQVTQLYAASGEGEYALDTTVLTDTADVRLFPNFDISTVADVLPVDPATGLRPDATYYARVRLGPTWGFRIEALRIVDASSAASGGEDLAASGTAAEASGQRRAVSFGTVVRRGSTQVADPPHAYPPGEAAFYTLDQAPDAFWFEDRGFCLVRLHSPVGEGKNMQSWDVAVDFGTSNTCVTWRAINSTDKPATFDFPVMTTTLLRTPVEVALEPVNEGGAAAADFFYKLSESDTDLLAPASLGGAPQPYFPTQILTQQEALPDQGSGGFDLAAGLILFQNPNLSGSTLLRLTKGFDLKEGSGGKPLTKRFHLKQDLKWSQREWLRVFMAHLRLQVILSAARQKARVNKVYFSYPKAFGGKKRVRYLNALSSVWGDDLIGGTASESEAVRHTLAGNANQHVVFDIGGGTADVIGFDSGEAAFQSSFQLAARQINDFVVQSPDLRAAFVNALDAAGMRGDFAANLGLFESGSDSQLLNAWVGLLQSIEYRDTNGRRLTEIVNELTEEADGAGARAVRGFMLSLVLMFGGLAYFGGRLLGMAADGAFGRAFPLIQVRLTLTGNGSKMYRLLSSEFAPFGRIFEHLFRKGLAVQKPEEAEEVRVIFDGIYTIEGVAAPKTTVALGLLDSGETNVPIPVANVVGEAIGSARDGDGDGAASGDESMSGSLVDFYTRLRSDATAYTPPSEAPAEMARFLDALHEVMPSGHNGFDTDFVIVPGLGADWNAWLKTDVYRDARGGLLERLRENTQDLPEGGAVGYVPALEPVFIAELVALIEQIREDATRGGAA